MWGSDGEQFDLIRNREDWRDVLSSDNPRMPHLVMQGNAVFRWASFAMAKVGLQALDRAGVSVEDLDCFVPHQANMRITEAVVKLTGMNPGKVDNSIRKYGNCASASVPISLDEAVRDGRIQPGDTVLMSTFASGFTWGAALLKW